MVEYSKIRPARKDFSGNLIRISIIEKEIEYAKSQLQLHDTGHIHTAISWMEHRIEELKGNKDGS